MENKKTKIKILIISLIIIGIITTIATIIMINKENKQNNEIIGVFIFDETTSYTFKKNGTGTMYVEGENYNYKYTCTNGKEGIIQLDFEEPKIHDATYQFKIEEDKLTLTGKQGTIGGEYLLKRKK